MNNQEIKERLEEITKALNELTQVVYGAKVINNEPDPNNQYDQIMHVTDYVFKYFDFEKVANMIQLVDWRWSNINRPITVNDIKKHVRYYIEYAIKYKCNISCGGFEFVYRSPGDSAVLDGCDYSEGKWPTVEIKFVGKQFSSIWENSND